jgi:hypothetical protein
MNAEFEGFIKDYFNDVPQLFEDIKFLERRRNLKLLSQLYHDKNEINFYSWISEMRFGLFFDNFCSELRHEERIDNKTPDWTIIINEQKILAEVLRVNTPENEMNEQIQLIKKIKKLQKDDPSLRFKMHSKVKIMSSEYLYGAQDKLIKKENNYREITLKYNLPFIICVACTLDTFLGGLDFFDFLIGHAKKGFFYSDVNFGKNITGILIKSYSNEFIYFHNEHADNKLNSTNMKFFETLFYRET